MGQFNVKQFCAEQLQRDVAECMRTLEVDRIRLGYLKQYNNAVKNDIDADRVGMQKKKMFIDIVK